MSIADLIDREWQQRSGLWHTATGWTVFLVGGADAHDFLNRMLSSVVSSHPRQGGLGACCSIDGRVRCLMLVFPFRDGFAYLAPSDTGAEAADHLRRYVLRSNVAITASTYDIVGLVGTDAGRWLNRHVGTVPDGDWRNVRLTDESVAIAVPGSIPRFWIIGEHSLPLDALPMIYDESLWTMLDVEAGIPWLTGVSGGQYLPQMLALPRWGATDFNKGCYPGQEVIIRLQHRGRLKRHLCRVLAMGTADDIQAGDPLLTAKGDLAGEIISGARGAALAVVTDMARKEAAPLLHKGHSVVVSAVDDEETLAT